MFKRFLILLIILFNYLNITAQDEQLYYKVQFDAITDFELPCNDGEGGIYYYKTSETINAEFKVSDSYGEYIFNIGDYPLARTCCPGVNIKEYKRKNV